MTPKLRSAQADPGLVPRLVIMRMWSSFKCIQVLLLMAAVIAQSHGCAFACSSALGARN